MKQKSNQIQVTIEELHKDVYDAFTRQKMTVEQIGKILHLSPQTIMQMLQTYQERKADGADA